MARRPTRSGELPTREQVLDWIKAEKGLVDKRDLAKAFGVRGPAKVQLKALLRDMANEGLIDGGTRGALTPAGSLPKVMVLRITGHDGSHATAIPAQWTAADPPPVVRVVERGRRGALGEGDRILARIEEAGAGYRAHPMKKLEAAQDEELGIVTADKTPSGKPMFVLRPVDKRQRREWPIAEPGDAQAGDLVLARVDARGRSAKVLEVLGDPFAPKALSLIAIHKFGIRHHFPEEVEVEAALASQLSLDDPRREDLTDLPIIAIDPVDARDHDDALWAEPDSDPSNPGGWRAIIAIADVSFYVRPGSALDGEARKRGNSVYFPDRVVPMLPHILSSGVCSLKAGEDRAAMVCHLRLDARGRVLDHRFTRAGVRLAANLAYERAQALIDGATPEGEEAALLAPLKALWGAWGALVKARDEREPLELDLPERQVRLDDAGRIVEVRVRERLDAHRLVEDFMIAANVAAAKALEAKQSPVMYRVHEPPSREKLVTLKEFLATYDQSFALGQVMTPAVFNRLIARFDEPEERARIMEQMLRTQTQAYYGSANAGHFGLALGSYAHFTSPIRRYADLLVHRALVSAYDLEAPPPSVANLKKTTRLSKSEGAEFARIGELISAAERRAMEAERETIDRYVAAYLSEKVGEVLATRITGVQPFGFFAQVAGLGGDGLVPARTLGEEYFRYEVAAQALVGEESGLRFTIGQAIDLRLTHADPVSGALMFALPDVPEGEGGRGRSAPRNARGGPRRPVGRRGRPANIRHQSR